MFAKMPWWWHDEDAVASIVIGLLDHVARTTPNPFNDRLLVPAHDAQRHLAAGHWRDAIELELCVGLSRPLALGMADQFLARLQELSPRPDRRAAITRAAQQLNPHLTEPVLDLVTVLDEE